jgi:hypothetical protein
MFHILGSHRSKVEPNKMGGLNVKTGKATSMASLIQERMAIDRALKAGRLWMVLGSIYVVMWVGGGFFLDFTWYYVFYLLAGTAFFGLGVFEFRRARRAEAVFDAAHGEDAGKQQPI